MCSVSTVWMINTTEKRDEVEACLIVSIHFLPYLVFSYVMDTTYGNLEILMHASLPEAWREVLSYLSAR